MKKSVIVSVLIVSLLVSVFCFTGCNPEKNTDTINIVMPDGAPALSMAKLLQDKPVIDGLSTNYEIVAGKNNTEIITAKMQNGEADVAIMPTNAAAILYNKGAKIQIVTANVFGLIYMVGKQDVTDLKDLKGKVVYSIGRGGTPELTFKYILDKAGIKYVDSDTAIEDKVALFYVNDGSELIPLLKKGDAMFGILGEPAATMACAKADCKVLFDMQQLWNTASGTTGGYPQASLVIRKNLIDSNPNFVKELIAKLTESADWIGENADKIGGIMTENGSVLGMSYTQPVIERCNIRVEKANDIKADVNTYLNVLYDFNKETVGGAMPDDNFYYAG